jgi:ribonucleotide monophosphatase NagD (HAD superfamily)
MHDVAFLDLDGVVYIGDHAVPGAADALAAARRSGMTLAFVTNNAGRPPEEVAAHLTELGIPADVEQVVTSAQAGAEVLARHLPAGADVLAHRVSSQVTCAAYSRDSVATRPGVTWLLRRSRCRPVPFGS